MNTLVLAPLIAVGLIVLVGLLIVSRIKVAGPNEAFIITGRRSRTEDVAGGQKVIQGASVFVIPVVQKLHRLNLESRQIEIRVDSAISQNGIGCSLVAVALVKVGGTEQAIRAAAQRFLNQQQEIDQFTTEVLSGSLRAIAGRMSVREIIADRAAFSTQVAEEAEESLTNQGLNLDAFQLQNISAEGDYLADLGRPEAASKAMAASVAEAEASRESEQARIVAEQEVLEAQMAYDLRAAEIKAETDRAKAEADAAGPLIKAEQDQTVIAAQRSVAEREAELTERRLDTEVRKPADAQRYKVEQDAEAAREARISKAEGEKSARVAQAEADKAARFASAEAVRVEGESDAAATLARGVAQADADKAARLAGAEAVVAEGDAEAGAIRARGEAEAETRRLAADAFEKYGDAAIADLLISQLPDIVGAASEPLSNIDDLTVVSTEGATSLTRTVSENVAQGTSVLESLAGVDLRSIIAAGLQSLAARDGNETDSSEAKGETRSITSAVDEDD